MQKEREANPAVSLGGGGTGAGKGSLQLTVLTHVGQPAFLVSSSQLLPANVISKSANSNWRHNSRLNMITLA